MPPTSSESEDELSEDEQDQQAAGSDVVSGVADLSIQEPKETESHPGAPASVEKSSAVRGESGDAVLNLSMKDFDRWQQAIDNQSDSDDDEAEGEDAMGVSEQAAGAEESKQ